MSTNRDKTPDPDDFFSETRMSFGDHIEDLRVHLLRAVKGFMFFCIFGFIIGKPVLALIAKPVSEQLEAFYLKRTEDELNEASARLRRLGQTLALRLRDLRTEWDTVPTGGAWTIRAIATHLAEASETYASRAPVVPIAAPPTPTS